MLKKLGFAAIFVIGAVAGALLAPLLPRPKASVTFDTPYQAVLLDNGQVYYGKIEKVGTAFPVLTDVYYVQNQVNPQTKEVTNLLVRRGKEWHAPDRMVLNARHIVLIEPVSPNSKVAELISQVKK